MQGSWELPLRLPSLSAPVSPPPKVLRTLPLPPIMCFKAFRASALPAWMGVVAPALSPFHIPYLPSGFFLPDAAGGICIKHSLVMVFLLKAPVWFFIAFRRVLGARPEPASVCCASPPRAPGAHVFDSPLGLYPRLPPLPALGVLLPRAPPLEHGSLGAVLVSPMSRHCPVAPWPCNGPA